MVFEKEDTVDIACLNGSLRCRNEAEIIDAMQSPKFRRGCFETMLAVDRQIPLIDLHLNRLQNSADFLNFEIPQVCTKERILRTIEVLYDVYRGEESRFRTRLTVFPSDEDESGWMLYMDPIVLPSKPYRLKLSPHLRESEPIEALRCKRSARDHYLAAYYDAIDDGFDDALMLTIDGYVSETTIANLFWIKNETLYMPSDKCYPLSGVGREVLFESLANDDIPVVEGEYSISEVLESDLVFLINAVRGPVPISAIGNTIKPTQNRVFTKLVDLYWANVMRKIG